MLTNLNPWVVGLHFLASMAVIAAAYALWRRVGRPGRPGGARGARGRCARWPCSPPWSASAVLVVGTWVTGSGPHAGDHGRRPQRARPGDRSPRCTPTLVFLLIGLSVALVFALPRGRRAAGAGPGRAGAGRGRAGPGPDRLRAVLHPPAGRAGRRAHARRLPGAAGHAGGAAGPPGERRPVTADPASPPTCSRCPPPSERTGPCRHCPGRPLSGTSGRQWAAGWRGGGPPSLGDPPGAAGTVSGGRGGSASRRRGGRRRRRRTRGTATARSAPARSARVRRPGPGCRSTRA